MIEEILDAQLDLRLFHFVLAALIVAFAQLATHQAKCGFQRFNRSGHRGALFHQG